MLRKVRENGNSIIIAVAPATLEVVGIKVGDIVDVVARNGKIEITKIKEDKPNG